MQPSLLPVIFLLALLVVAHAQWKGAADFKIGSTGPDLKLSLGRDVGRWNFKGFGSTDFRGGWSAGIGVGIKFKRSTGENSRKHVMCHFFVYDENNDGVITKEEMIGLFDDETRGSNLYDVFNTTKENLGITKSDFYKRVASVIKGCDNNIQK